MGGWVGVGISTHSHPRTHTQMPTYTHIHRYLWVFCVGENKLSKCSIFCVGTVLRLVKCVAVRVAVCVALCAALCVAECVAMCIAVRVAVCVAGCVTACVAVWTTVCSCFRDSVVKIGTVRCSFPRSGPLLFIRTKNLIFCFLCAFVGKRKKLFEQTLPSVIVCKSHGACARALPRYVGLRPPGHTDGCTI